MLICSISANYRLQGWKILYFCSFGPPALLTFRQNKKARLSIRKLGIITSYSCLFEGRSHLFRQFVIRNAGR